MIVQLPVEELVALRPKVEERLDTLTMIEVAETQFQSREPEEDIDNEEA
ncbi:hypothetical protein NDI37_15550 [Funiculus sociatus GB2-A5]|uniref:Uncharacterized protein n=1 Tax=Funiculus sociatus GB2-A5 TaxID=2933946 RepID=A0ABV0JQY6_9CYAN|nr:MULTISPECIES: hypothetical protein [unclassified Trichocoleus]MBD1905293.1 hypothetical protein [Trichocoleus sp. FACHB-832]MBD2062695.1 hypothetical protein [Trichocoleus sp. FACHB-6]